MKTLLLAAAIGTALALSSCQSIPQGTSVSVDETGTVYISAPLFPSK